MKCSKCDNPSEHSVQIREGSTTPELTGKGRKQSSRMRVFGLCSEHWDELLEFLGLSREEHPV